ncbi:hypothetical protein TNCT_633711 [Trichonephila clavata]|uniref:Uncharacterized protein n=1 Tax=Trichonephila clavata TaxID=2740835 RepID=A0A8X6KQF3_TRICU|nr:hypothetical protein TNCT_633711 [Trichonephila clavata]
MDPHHHQDLLHIWTLRSKQATLDEQHCVERILGRDNVRSSDLIKLASILQKISDPKTVYEFFAMDATRERIPRNISTCFATRPKRRVANTSETSVSCIARARADPSRMSILLGKYF